MTWHKAFPANDMTRRKPASCRQVHLHAHCAHTRDTHTHMHMHTQTHTHTSVTHPGIQTRMFLIEGLASTVQVPLPAAASHACGLDSTAQPSQPSQPSSQANGTQPPLRATWQDRIRSASVESHVYDGFLPLWTESPEGTARLLGQLSREIASAVASKGLGADTALMAANNTKFVTLPELQVVRCARRELRDGSRPMSCQIPFLCLSSLSFSLSLSLSLSLSSPSFLRYILIKSAFGL